MGDWPGIREMTRVVARKNGPMLAGAPRLKQGRIVYGENHERISGWQGTLKGVKCLLQGQTTPAQNPPLMREGPKP